MRTPDIQIRPDTKTPHLYDLAKAKNNSECNFRICQLHLRQVASSRLHVDVAIPTPPTLHPPSTVPGDTVYIKRFICLFQHRVPCRCDQRLNVLKRSSVSRTACRPMRVTRSCKNYRIFKRSGVIRHVDEVIAAGLNRDLGKKIKINKKHSR